jgi:hypothetical protein
MNTQVNAREPNREPPGTAVPGQVGTGFPHVVGNRSRPTPCRHDRVGSCAYGMARIRADHYWAMVRWQVELRRQGRRRRAS